MAGKAQGSADGGPREERVAELPQSADRDASLEERAERARPDQAEPAGDQDPAAERQIEEATVRAEDVEGASAPSPAPPAAASEPAGEADAAVDGPSHEDASAEGEGPLAVAERQRDEYLALAQRTQADFENYRRRAAKEAAAAGARAKGGLVRELLPVVDNLERALASADESEQHLAEGVRLVHSELVAVLARHGVEAYDPAGESFDPALHEALSVRNEEGAEAGRVLDVVEKGYKLDGSVLRPARVVVSG